MNTKATKSFLTSFHFLSSKPSFLRSPPSSILLEPLCVVALPCLSTGELLRTARAKRHKCQIEDMTEFREEFVFIIIHVFWKGVYGFYGTVKVITFRQLYIEES